MVTERAACDTQGDCQQRNIAAEPSAGRETRQNVLFLRLDVGKLQPIEVTAAIDTLDIEFRSHTRTLARAVTPIFGTMSARELTAIAIQAMSVSVFLRNSGLLRQPRFWLQLVLTALRLPANLRHARPRLGPKSVFGVRALARRVSRAAILATAGPPDESDSARTLARLIDEDRAQIVAAAIDPLPVKDSSVPPEEDYVSPAGRRRYWEQIYRTPDPWAYGSAYEQLKYRRTLELIPPGAVVKAVELACSEGRFTEMLAARVERLTAIDISGSSGNRVGRFASATGQGCM